MSYHPLIAVVAYHLGDDRVARLPHGGYGFPGPYLECLRRAGARTAIVSPGEDCNSEGLLEPLHVPVLFAVGDVDAARSGGEARVGGRYGEEADRAGLEMQLLR